MHNNLLLIIFGVALRVKHFLENRSLRLDEAYVANHLSALSLKQIFFYVPFDTDLPFPPLLFMIAEKLSIMFLGNNEFAFRAFPLICGITSIILFYKFLKEIASPKAIFIALALFAFSDILIYYSAELKQYASDVTFTLILYLTALYSTRKQEKQSYFTRHDRCCSNFIFLSSHICSRRHRIISINPLL